MRSPRSWLRDVTSYRSGMGPTKNLHRRSENNMAHPKECPPAKTIQGLAHERRLQRPLRHSSNGTAPRQREQVSDSDPTQGNASSRNAHRSTSTESRSPSVQCDSKRLGQSTSVPALRLPVQQGKRMEARGSANVPPAEIMLPARAIEQELVPMLATPTRKRTLTAGSTLATPTAITDSALKKSEELLAEMVAAFGTEETPKAEGKRRMSLESVPESVRSSLSIVSNGQAPGALLLRETVEVPVALLDMLTDTWGKYRDLAANAEESVKKQEFDNLKRDLASLHQAGRYESTEIEVASSTGSETWNQIAALRKKLECSSVASCCSTGASMTGGSLSSPSISLSSFSRSQGASLSAPSRGSQSPLKSPSESRSNSVAYFFDSACRTNNMSAPPPTTNSITPQNPGFISAEMVNESPRRSMSPESWAPKKRSAEDNKARSSSPGKPAAGSGPLPPRQPSRHVSTPTLLSARAPSLERPFSPRMVPTTPSRQASPRDSSLTQSRQLSPREVLPAPAIQHSPRDLTRVLSPRGMRTSRVVSPRDVQSRQGLSVSASASTLPLVSPTPSQLSPREGRTPRLISRARVTQTINVTNIVDIYAH